jgi:hypothetical protein
VYQKGHAQRLLFHQLLVMSVAVAEWSIQPHRWPGSAGTATGGLSLARGLGAYASVSLRRRPSNASPFIPLGPSYQVEYKYDADRNQDSDSPFNPKPTEPKGPCYRNTSIGTYGTSSAATCTPPVSPLALAG